jgi:hypothetical protein
METFCRGDVLCGDVLYVRRLYSICTVLYSILYSIKEIIYSQCNLNNGIQSVLVHA